MFLVLFLFTIKKVFVQIASHFSLAIFHRSHSVSNGYVKKVKSGEIVIWRLIIVIGWEVGLINKHVNFFLKINLE